MRSLLLYCLGPVTWEELDMTLKYSPEIKIKAESLTVFTLYPIWSRALSTSVAPLNNSTRLLFSSLSSAVMADLSVTNL